LFKFIEYCVTFENVNLKNQVYGTVMQAILLSVNKHCCFDVLLTVHLSIILVINQLDAQNLVLL